jgi:glycosyltransferase involved in cell wall biosynthesis
MRILIFNWRDLAHPASGGAEVFVQEVAGRWARGGHEVTLFTAAAEGRPSEERVAGVRIIRQGSRLAVYARGRRYYSLYGRGRYDLVLDVVNTRPFHTPDFVTDVPVVALIFQVAREVWGYEFPAPLSAVGRHWLEPRWLDLYRDTPTLTISESSRRSLLDYGLTNVHLVPVGLSLPEPLPAVKREEQPTFLFVGRLAANKRPDDALIAFEQARLRHPEARLWIVGTGPMERHLTRIASSSVEFLGRVSDDEKFQLYGRAHALVVTSVREGWGMVVSEAAAMGTPAIAYDVPGLRDSVRAAGGILVPPSATALARRLSRLMDSGLPTGPVSTNGVRSWDDVADAVLDRALAIRR